MKVLVLSDSHGVRSFMRRAVEIVRPDAIIHLGDHYADGELLSEEFPHIPMYQVPGNCDQFRTFGKPDFLCLSVGGAMLYMTHGHREGVKYSLGKLLSEARRFGAQAALYGHTHTADCHREEDGLWVINPGSSSYGGSVAVLSIENGQLQQCRSLRADALIG